MRLHKDSYAADIDNWYWVIISLLLSFSLTNTWVSLTSVHVGADEGADSNPHYGTLGSRTRAGTVSVYPAVSQMQRLCDPKGDVDPRTVGALQEQKCRMDRVCAKDDTWNLWAFLSFEIKPKRHWTQNLNYHFTISDKWLMLYFLCFTFWALTLTLKGSESCRSIVLDSLSSTLI